jgi:nitric-oxide synthase
MNLADSATSPFQLPEAGSRSASESKRELKTQARGFLEAMAADSVAGKWIPDVTERWRQIELEISSTGTYTHTYKELRFGTRLAWRNSNRCIGRHFWRTLQVVDARQCDTAEDAHRHLANHVNEAFNGGHIQNVITVFPPRKPGAIDAWRMVNHQLIRYAGFKQEKGATLGDPDSVDFTEYCASLGWNGARTRWTPLPWVMVKDGIALPPHDPFQSGALTLQEVPIIHPDHGATAELDLRWYAVPLLADMALKIGGVVYPFAPFNGHYLGTEIAARNLTDPDRYNVLEPWAKACGIQPSTQRSLWKDEALVKLNQALLSSFDHAGITMGDHHEMGRAFEGWCQAEAKQGREVPGDWSWLTPPISGSLTPQFHRSFSNAVVTHTNYFYQEPVKVKGMSYPSKAKDTHRLLVGDAFSQDQPPATCPFSKLSSTFKNLWS